VALVAPDGSVAFTGDTVSGPATRVYSIPALKAGTYHFRCDIHPGMTGTLIVH
jgi:plastocyanin